MPAARVGQLAGGLEMCGDQSCVLVGGAAVACLNSGGQRAMDGSAWKKRAAPQRGQFAGDAPKFLARESRPTEK